ncbi:hypothetical protein [Sphaerisporangium corydalis]|uniref:Uncharacterized protein n=1 Tax=Sphaerisporangium corydalis TaxID=1441875 RepID=A0ABV9ENJ6_9ACTN|nr:hypothetical protein [Sphaerisporangium corydalis]
MNARTPRPARRVHAPAPPSSRWDRLKRQARRPLVWLVATLGTALAGVVAALVSQAGAPLVEAVGGDPVSAVVASSESLGGYALPGAFFVSPDRTVPGDSVPGYLTAQGAVPVGVLRMVVVLEGRGRGGVRITGIRPVVVERGEALSGTYLQCCVYGAGPVDPLLMEVELGAGPPVLLLGGRPYFPGKNIDLDLNERITLNVEFSAARHRYAWYLEVAFTAAGRAGTMRITDAGGRPFALTDRAARYGARFAEDPAQPGLFTAVTGHR